MPIAEGTFLERLASAMREREAVDETIARLSSRLNEARISYALIGATAMAAHGLYRFTAGVDVLTTCEGLDHIHAQLVGRGFQPASAGARKNVRDTVSGVPVDFMIASEYPGDGKPKPVMFPDPDTVAVDLGGVKVISLPKLIELKLTSGLTAPNRLKDIGDTETVIERLKPPRELGEEIDPFVRDQYYRMWDAAQNAWHPSNE
jgi:hypothetical protein